MKYVFKILLINLLVLLLSSCASINTLSVQDRQQIKTVKISNQISMPKNMLYTPPGASYIGLLDLPMEMKATRQIKYITKRYHINLAEIFRKQFINALQANTHFKLVKKGIADANINLSITNYGFSVPWGLVPYMQPTLNVAAQMYRGNRLVWSYKNRTLCIEGTPHYTESQLIHNPEAIRQAWTEAAKRLAAEMVKTMYSK